MIPQIHLRRGKEESLLRRHPWIFSGAIESVRYDGSEIPEGALVDVYTRSGDFIARGHYQIGSPCGCSPSNRNRSTRPGGSG